jgi:UDP-glucose 4-epimerase
MHFAAHISVESIVLPFEYYGDNACATRTLLQACIENLVKNFVFCSIPCRVWHAPIGIGALIFGACLPEKG